MLGQVFVADKDAGDAEHGQEGGGLALPAHVQPAVRAQPARRSRWIFGDHRPAWVQVWNQRCAVAREMPNKPSALSQEQLIPKRAARWSTPSVGRRGDCRPWVAHHSQHVIMPGPGPSRRASEMSSEAITRNNALPMCWVEACSPSRTALAAAPAIARLRELEVCKERHWCVPEGCIPQSDVEQRETAGCRPPATCEFTHTRSSAHPPPALKSRLSPQSRALLIPGIKPFLPFPASATGFPHFISIPVDCLHPPPAERHYSEAYS